MKTSNEIRKVRILKPVNKNTDKELYVVVSNYFSSNSDTILFKFSSSQLKEASKGLKN